MPMLSRTRIIAAPAERVFAYVDDIRNLARHMSERPSMPMMGSRLDLEIATNETTGVGAIYHYTGRIMGLVIDFSEAVTHYVRGREKAWHTIGEPQLLIISSYEMRLSTESFPSNATRLTISIDYELPRSGLWRLVGLALARSYADWCLASMLDGTKAEFDRPA